jgi:hypothetical protein
VPINKVSKLEIGVQLARMEQVLITLISRPIIPQRASGKNLERERRKLNK